MKTVKSNINSGIRTIAGYAVAACAMFIFGVSSASAATFTVSATTDAGAGSLRDAITQANATPGADMIDFSFASGTIVLVTPLPAITETVSIINTGAPGIELNGAGAGPTAIGIWIRASGCVVQGLVINRFQEAGIRIDTGGGNTIINNFIGTNVAGTAALPNFNRGILIVGTTGNFIGNGTVAGRNIISGNSGRGIDINAGGSATVSGNYIGTNAAGTGKIPNNSHGIEIVDSSGSTIGGTTAITRNVISGNDGDGVLIIGDIGLPASNNVVSGNYIGVDSTGGVVLNNTGSGVTVQGSNNIIGGTVAGARNVISGNSVNGVAINSSLATGNIVAGNYIGVGANGTTSIPNVNDGVRFSNNAANNIVGGTDVTVALCNASCNTIANNGVATSITARAGIYADQTSGTSNQFRRNSIFNNGATNANIGIDIGPSGSTANDANDPDTGANNLQNFPALNSANTAGVVGATINSTPNTTFAIDFYRNDAADTAALAEARLYIGTSTVTTNASGNATISFFTTPTTLTAGQFVTATATTTGGGGAQAIGDTSELSNAQAVVAATPGGAAGIEADVAPRPNGDGQILSNDVVQMRRFLNGTDTFDTTVNEYQRADSAPFSSKGDGMILSNDVVQTERYLNGSDPLQTAGGPTTGTFANPAGAVVSGGKASKDATPSVLRVESTKANAGQRVTVNIRIDTVGRESEYGFILDYDQANLSHPVIGAGNAGAKARACNVRVAGRINCSVGSFANNMPGSSSAGIAEAFPGRDNTLITVTFDVAAKASSGVTQLTLSGVNVSDDAAELLMINSTNGSVTIDGPNAASVSLSGIVMSAPGRAVNRARVDLTGGNGQKLVAFTNSFGYYRFENVATGENYTVAASHKQYRFTPRHITVNDAVSDLNFTAEPWE